MDDEMSGSAASDSTSSTGPTRRGNRAWVGSLEATRRSLLSRLRRHDDRDAWQRFFDTYAAVIHACARKSGLSAVEADEALQETLLSVAKEMPNFRYDPAIGSFKGWLFKVTKRRIADQFRRRARYGGKGAEISGVADAVPDPSADELSRLWEEEWRQSQIHLAMGKVRERSSAKQWQLFDLAVLKQWPTERICATLGVNRAQIYMAKLRIGRALKSELAKGGSERIGLAG